MRNNVWRAMALFMTASLVFGGCSGKQEEVVEESALRVNVKTAKKKTLVIAESYVGTTSAQEEVTVYPNASGEVMQVNVKMGDTVTEGQQLFKLDDESARLSLKSAQAAHASAAASANAQLGGQEALKEQQEQQQIDSYTRSAEAAERAALEAEHNLDRGERRIDEAVEDRDKAREDYDEAVDKYHKAKRFYDELRDLCEDDDIFAGVSSLTEAASKAGSIVANPETTITFTDPTTGATLTDTEEVDGLDTAEDIMDLVDDVSDEEDISVADVSASGVNALKSTMESLQTALVNQRRAVDNAKDNLVDYKRAEKNASDSQTNAQAAVDDAVANQSITDGQLLADTRRSLQASVANSAVGVEQAQYALDQYVGKAPINGVVESVDISTHDTVGPSTAAMVISNKDTMKIDFSVTEKVRDNLSVGQSVRVKKDGNKYKGTISEIGETLDANTGLFKVQAVVNGDERLLSGTTVTVKVDSYRDDSGIVIPYDAVYYSNGEPYVYVAEDGVAKKRDVTTGMFDEKHIVITSGLSTGESVITSWASDLRDGAEIEVVPKEGKAEAEKNEDSATKGSEAEKSGEGGSPAEAADETEDKQDKTDQAKESQEKDSASGDTDKKGDN